LQGQIAQKIIAPDCRYDALKGIDVYHSVAEDLNNLKHIDVLGS
jgi:hypothetical protein